MASELDKNQDDQEQIEIVLDDDSKKIDSNPDLSDRDSSDNDEQDHADEADAADSEDDADEVAAAKKERTPEEQERIRERRREEQRRRKENNRRMRLENLQFREQLAAQERRIEELNRHLASINTTNVQKEFNELENAIKGAEVSVDRAIQERARAQALADEDAIYAADKKLLDHQRALQRLEAYRENVLSEAERQKQRLQSQAAPADRKSEEAVRHNLNIFMQRNAWVDINVGDDDSKVADEIARRYRNMGYDPSTSEYWNRVESELRTLFPEKYRANAKRTEQMSNGSTRNPVASGNGNGSGNIKKHRLNYTAERLDAMRQAGIDPNSPAGKEMLMAYKKFDDQNKGAA